MPTSSATERRRKRPGSAPRDRRGGFTLAEMALALAVIGLLAALGLPHVRLAGGVTALRLKTVEVVALLKSERNAALRSGMPGLVVVDAGDRVLVATVSRARIRLPASMALRTEVRGIQFFPDGRSSGGRIALATGRATAVVAVNGLTSAVEVEGP